jgi:hypothetical protein
LLSDFKVRHHLEKDKPEKPARKKEPFPKKKNRYLFPEVKTDREIILEARNAIHSESLKVKKMKWDLLKDQFTDDEIKAVKDSPFEPENRWALAEWKKRVKNWIDKLQLKLFP